MGYILSTRISMPSSWNRKHFLTEKWQELKIGWWFQKLRYRETDLVLLSKKREDHRSSLPFKILNIKSVKIPIKYFADTTFWWTHNMRSTNSIWETFARTIMSWVFSSRCYTAFIQNIDFSMQAVYDLKNSTITIYTWVPMSL